MCLEKLYLELHFDFKLEFYLFFTWEKFALKKNPMQKIVHLTHTCEIHVTIFFLGKLCKANG